MPSWESSVEKKLKIFPIGRPTATRNIAVQSSAQFFPGIDRILSIGRGFIIWSNFFCLELWSGLFAAQMTLSKFHVQLHLRANNFKCSYLCLWKFMNVVLPINDYRSQIVTSFRASLWLTWMERKKIEQARLGNYIFFCKSGKTKFSNPNVGEQQIGPCKVDWLMLKLDDHEDYSSSSSFLSTKKKAPHLKKLGMTLKESS